jgi:uncharacterized protein (DUF1778 family)
MANKSEQIQIRCTEAQREQWEAAAEQDRRTLTDWIRIKLDDAAADELKAAEKKQK